MRAAALKFPDLVAGTPMRTHALLTKYSALRSFYVATLGLTKTLIPNYESAGVYTLLLEEAYLEYKTISKNLQVLSFDVSSGVATLEEVKQVTIIKTDDDVSMLESKPAKYYMDDSDSDSAIAIEPSVNSESNAELTTTIPLRITKPYQPTLAGLKSARQDVRAILSRIAAEVDRLARSPEIALDERRRLPFMAPPLFKEMLPTSRPVVIIDDEVYINPMTDEDDPKEGKEDMAAELTAMAERSGGKNEILAITTLDFRILIKMPSRLTVAVLDPEKCRFVALLMVHLAVEGDV